jgi:hypothetical protein
MNFTGLARCAMSILISEHFQQDIQAACGKAITQFRNDYPDAEVCGFALYSDGDARTLVPAFNTADHLKRTQAENPEDWQYFKWSPAEWSHEAFGGEHFNNLSRLLWRLADSVGDEDFVQHRNQVFEQCVEALKAIASSVFEGAIFVFSVSDYQSPEDEIAWITTLNTPEQAHEFKTWTMAWG